MGQNVGEHRVPVRKIPLRRHRHRWDDNIKIDIKDGELWTRFICSGLGPMTGSCEHGSVFSGSHKMLGKFFEWLSCCWLLKKDSAP
jgi:hypothetical protein